MIRAFLLTLSCAVSLTLIPPVNAQADDAVNAHKIDIAGRQRMLTQRIAKAACYVATFNDVEKHTKMLQDSIDLFEKSHQALQYGDTKLGLPRETSPNVVRALQEIDQPWQLLKFAAKLLLDMPSYPGSDIDMIARFNPDALKQAHEAVKVMEETYAAQNASDSGALHAINIAGRQRMLSQKAAKEFCLYSYGYNSAENTAELHKTINAFDQALEDLKDGNPDMNIPPAPTGQIVAHILQIKSNWQSAREIFLASINGEKAQSADFTMISYLNDALLDQSDQLVKMLLAHEDQKAQQAAPSN